MDNIIADFFELGSCRFLLDLGCGSGLWTGTLMRQLGKSSSVVGVDLDESKIRAAKKRLAKGSELVISDIYALPFRDNMFDLVTCRRLLMNLKNTRKAMNEMIRVTGLGKICSCVEPSFEDISAYSTVRGEIEFLEKLEKTTSSADLSFGPKAASLFVNSGLKDVDVWSYSTTESVLPPYKDMRSSRLHGFRNLKTAVKGFMSDGTRRGVKSMMKTGERLDNERKSQMKDKRYVKVEAVPFIITRGTKPKKQG